MLRGKLKFFNFLATCAPNNSRENKSFMILIYAVQHSAILVHIFVASCKRVFTYDDLRVTFPFNANLNVAKALPVFLY